VLCVHVNDVRAQLGLRAVCLNRPAQFRKLDGPYYRHKFAEGRKSVFHFDVENSL